jgi:hypothetical protein
MHAIRHKHCDHLRVGPQPELKYSQIGDVARGYVEELERARDISKWVPKFRGNIPLHSALVVFREKLLFYATQIVPALNIKPDLSWREIARISLSGFEGIAALKKRRDKSNREARKVFDGVFELNSFPTRHMIQWCDESVCKDFEWSFRPPGEVSESLLNRVKKIMREHVSRAPLQYFDVIDSLFLYTRAKCLKGHKTLKSQDCRDLYDTRMTSEFRFLIKKTTTYPDESRELAIQTAPTRNTTYITRANAAKVLWHPNDAFYSDIMKVEAELSGDENTYFILIDQKKFGWSVPKEVIIAVVDVLIVEYPEFEPFQNLKDGILNTVYVFPDGRERTSVRGCTLGLQDHLFSFFCSCLFEYFTKYKLPSELDAKITGKFKGDDSYIRVETSDYSIVKDIYLKWVYLFKKLNVMINAEKSHIAHGSGVFCERYGPRKGLIHRKIASEVLNIFDALTKPFWVAKEFVANMMNINSGYATTPWGDKVKELSRMAVGSMLCVKGFEFDRTEITLPVCLGGWFRHIEDGFDMTATWLEKCESFDQIPQSYLRVGMMKPFQVKLETLPDKARADEEFKKLKAMKIFETETFMKLTQKAMFGVDTDRRRVQKYISWYAEQRQAAFHSKRKYKIKKLEIIHKLIGTKTGRFMLPRQFIVDSQVNRGWFEWTQTRKVEDSKIPWTKNRRLNYFKLDEYRLEILLQARKYEVPNPLRVRYTTEIPILILFLNYDGLLNQNFAMPRTWYEYASERSMDIYQMDRMCKYYGLDLNKVEPIRKIRKPRKSMAELMPEDDSMCFGPKYHLPIGFNSHDVHTRAKLLQERGSKDGIADALIEIEGSRWFNSISHPLFEEVFYGDFIQKFYPKPPAKIKIEPTTLEKVLAAFEQKQEQLFFLEWVLDSGEPFASMGQESPMETDQAKGEDILEFRSIIPDEGGGDEESEDEDLNSDSYDPTDSEEESDEDESKAYKEYRRRNLIDEEDPEDPFI